MAFEFRHLNVINSISTELTTLYVTLRWDKVSDAAAFNIHLYSPNWYQKYTQLQ